MVKDTYGQFYVHPSLDGQHFADTKQKRYTDVVMCEIFIKGSANTSNSMPVHDANGDLIEYPDADGNLETLPERYPKAWAAYNRDYMPGEDGTPLLQLSGIGPGQIKNFQAMGIETVEDLAELSDAYVVGERGMLEFRKRAQAYLGAMHPEKAEAEKQAQQDVIDGLQDTVKLLQAELEAMKKPKGKK